MSHYVEHYPACPHCDVAVPVAHWRIHEDEEVEQLSLAVSLYLPTVSAVHPDLLDAFCDATTARMARQLKSALHERFGMAERDT